jgi:hypothetical protein
VWFELCKGKVQCRAFVRTVLNIRYSEIARSSVSVDGLPLCYLFWWFCVHISAQRSAACSVAPGKYQYSTSSQATTASFNLLFINPVIWSYRRRLKISSKHFSEYVNKGIDLLDHLSAYQLLSKHSVPLIELVTKINVTLLIRLRNVRLGWKPIQILLAVVWQMVQFLTTCCYHPTCTSVGSHCIEYCIWASCCINISFILYSIFPSITQLILYCPSSQNTFGPYTATIRCVWFAKIVALYGMSQLLISHVNAISLKIKGL